MRHQLAPLTVPQSTIAAAVGPARGIGLPNVTGTGHTPPDHSRINRGPSDGLDCWTGPGDRPTERASERPSERPTERVRERPTERVSERPTERVSERPTERASAGYWTGQLIAAHGNRRTQSARPKLEDNSARKTACESTTRKTQPTAPGSAE